ncbi:MAG TPA: C40 family peptidase [Pedococcus sp.]|uniref:C40 family peptidase n=1 Tax=Pedococcus sp. TaxID=2860345 RepID=UPI002F95B822
MTSRAPASRPARLALALALSGALATGTATVAAADPGPGGVFPSQQEVDRARAAAASTAGRVAALDARFAASQARLAQVQTEAAAASEAYNGARVALQKRVAEADAARARAASAQRRADAASLEVRQYAAAVYQQGGSLGDLEAFLSSRGPQELLDRAASLEAVGAARHRTLQTASATSVVADTMRRQAAVAEAQQLAAAQRAETARRRAQAQASSVAAATAQIQREQQAVATELAALRHTSVALERQRQDGLRAAAQARAAAAAAAEQARLAAARAQAARSAAARRAAARARAEAARQAAAAAEAERAAREAANRPTPRPKPKPTTPPPPPPPPSTSGGVSAVVAYARAQIGKPYQWGGEGPGSFDCSGLTMMAWRQAGVYLSHYTGAQWAETARVPVSDLRPGDLVFFGSSGESSHHVGLYIGGGQMIEAPYTGATIREASIYRSDLLPYGGRVR